MAKSTSKTAGSRVKAAENRRLATRLREAGFGFDDIAKQIGCSTSRAHQYVTEALDGLQKMTDESAEVLRQLELERLDRMQSSIWNNVKQGNLGAIDRALRISERRAKLLGIDAPTKTQDTTPKEKSDSIVEKIRKRQEQQRSNK